MIWTRLPKPVSTPAIYVRLRAATVLRTWSVRKVKMTAPLAVSSAQRFAGCVQMPLPETVPSPNRCARFVPISAFGVRSNAKRMTWIIASAVPKPVADALMPAAQWRPEGEG
jgi:hypothetical protein